MLKGSKHPFEEERMRRLAALEVRRSLRPASMNNHAFVAGGEEYLTRTSEIAVPALIIHGTEDPIIPYAHGQRLAHVITGIYFFDAAGHELHTADWGDRFRPSSVIRGTACKWRKWYYEEKARVK